VRCTVAPLVGDVLVFIRCWKLGGHISSEIKSGIFAELDSLTSSVSWRIVLLYVSELSTILGTCVFECKFLGRLPKVDLII